MTAGRALVGRLNVRNSRSKHDNASIRSSESWKYQERLGSGGENRDVNMVDICAMLPADPSKEKVLRKF